MNTDARRTVEGGRNLRAGFWAIAEEPANQTETPVQSNDSEPDKKSVESKSKPSNRAARSRSPKAPQMRGTLRSPAHTGRHPRNIARPSARN